MVGTIAPLLEGFSDRATAAKDELRTCAACDPVSFRQEAIPLLKNGVNDAAARYLFHLLLKYGQLAEYLADPSQCGKDEAIVIGKAAQTVGVPLEAALESILSASVKDASAGPLLIRIIDLFSALSSTKVVLRLQKELLEHKDLKVCSRAVSEIVRAGKGATLVAQTLLQGDARVQANAVEALWYDADKNVKPVLLLAAKSPHNRVAANGLLGLYRQGWIESVPRLLTMASHADYTHRISAIWAIGETGDPRFLPYLNRQFPTAVGKEKLAIVRSLSRIRKQVRSAGEIAAFHATVHESAILPDNSRRVVLAVRTAGQGSESASSQLNSTHFAVFEGGELVTNYTTRCLASPPLLILGIAVPRFVSQDDPYAEAVARALNTLIELRRTSDPCCMERYLVDSFSRDAVKEQESSLAGPEDRSPIALHKKRHRGFVTNPDFLRELVAQPGPRERAAFDVAACIEKLVDTTSRLSGPRHLFVFFDPHDPADEPLHQLLKTIREEPVIFHGFAPICNENFYDARTLCTSINGGTFTAVAPEDLERVVSHLFLGMLDRYEIVYQVDSGAAAAANCEVQVCGTTLPISFPAPQKIA